MPEGVEVKLQLEKLHKLINQPITNISIFSGRYTRHGHPKNFAQFKKSLPLTIQSIHHKGKFIYFTLSNNWRILITLGMTGKLNIHKSPIKHDHILFQTPKYNLFFNDLRNFGTIEFTNNPNILLKKLDKLGFDPLQEKIPFSQFLAHIGKFSGTIGDLMLEQKFISGIGNYLRADILYCAKINPKTLIKKLNINTLKILLKCIVKTMTNSYKKQKDHSHKFIIYKQKISPLNNPISKYKDKKGRTIWYCPKEQTL